MEEAIGGSRQAFAQLVATYHVDLVRLCLVICGDEDVARDAAQSAWGLAWRNRGQLRDRRRLRSWLLTIAGNEARRAMRRRRIAHIPENLLEPAASQVDHIGLIDLDRALRRLTPDERRLLGLRYVSGYSSAELARELRITPEGVRSRLKRLLDRLREELRDG